MKILDEPKIQMPSDIDEQCLELCNALNRLPFVETRESCAGHGKHPYWIFFRCYDAGVLSRLGRSVARNYSDGNWEIVVDSCDGDPYGCFWLRTKGILNDNELNESLKQLIENINYWFGDEFDGYFKQKTMNGPWGDPVDGKEILETLIPEFKESEDDRIRKDIIAIFKGEIPYTSEEDAKRYIAWLEKQGEQKSVLDELEMTISVSEDGYLRSNLEKLLKELKSRNNNESKN